MADPAKFSRQVPIDPETGEPVKEGPLHPDTGDDTEQEND